MTDEEIRIRDIVYSCMKSLQDEVNHLIHKACDQQKQIEKQQIEIDVLVKILGERKLN